MVARALIAAAVLAATVVGGEYAGAAPRVLCQQVLDPTGDAQPLGTLNPTGQPQYGSLDIVSVDVATGPRNVVGVLRLKTLAPDDVLPTGATYEVRFTAGSTVYHLWYRIFFGGGTEFTMSTSASDAGQFGAIKGSVDVGTASITFVLPRRAVPELGRSRALTAIEGHASFGENLPALAAGGQHLTSESRGSSSVDDATRPGYRYRDRTPTCVKGT